LPSAAVGVTIPPADRAPLDILRERYAKGEIDEATFERMKRELDL